MPRRNEKQRLCKIWGGGGVNKVHNGSVQVAYSLRLCMHDKCWGCLCETLTDML